MPKTRTLKTRIVVPGTRKPTELGAGSDELGKCWLLFGDPDDIVRFLNNEGFPAHRVHAATAQDKNAIMVVASK